jgi:AAA15 family ATPase/GTPase
MITKIRITPFRGLEDLELTNLSTINLITGPNSIGKTALLEAIYLASAIPESLPDKFRISSSNPQNHWDTFWCWIFPEKQTGGKVKIELFEKNKTWVFEAHIPQGQRNTIQVELTANGVKQPASSLAHISRNRSYITEWPHATAFSLSKTSPETEAEKFSSLASTKDGEEQLLNLLRVIDNRVTKLRYLKITNNPLVYVDVGLGNLIPVSQMGQGFCILFSLFLEVLTSPSEIILIDEIENGLHRSIMPTIWQNLAQLMSSKKVQLFATTHSVECRNAAYAASQASEHITFSQHELSLQGTKVVCNSSENLI